LSPKRTGYGRIKRDNIAGTEYVTIRDNPQSRWSTKHFLQSSKLGLTQPLTRRRVCPPPWFGGRGTLAVERGGWDSHNSDEGTTLWYSIYRYFVRQPHEIDLVKMGRMFRPLQDYFYLGAAFYKCAGIFYFDFDSVPLKFAEGKVKVIQKLSTMKRMKEWGEKKADNA
jgi:hypothetical protein